VDHIRQDKCLIIVVLHVARPPGKPDNGDVVLRPCGFLDVSLEEIPCDVDGCDVKNSAHDDRPVASFDSRLHAVATTRYLTMRINPPPLGGLRGDAQRDTVIDVPCGGTFDQDLKSRFREA
jgi:hypothetical protein